MVVFAVQKDTVKPSTTQKTYHNPLSELYFAVKIVITFTFSIWSVVMTTAFAAKENKKQNEYN